MCKYVVITGASGGLGQAIVKQYAQKDYYLLLLARNEQQLHALKTQYEHQCAGIAYYCADFNDPSAYTNVIQWIDGRVDILIHNAGYGLYLTAEHFQAQHINAIFNVNVFAPLQLTTALLPVLYEKRQGTIVFVASQASKMVTPKSSLYSATKFALRGYANGLRLEAKQKGVHVLVVNPGPIDTDFFAIADQTGLYGQAVETMMLQPDDVAKALYGAVLKRKREVNLPKWMAFSAILSEVFPNLSDLIIARFGNKK